MPEEPPWAGSFAAIEIAKFSIRLKPSTVAMLGIIMPSRTATPQVARPRSVRLPEATRPAFSIASIAGNERMMTSVFSPPSKRALSAPTVLKLRSTSMPLAFVNAGASSATGPSTAPALINLILLIRYEGPSCLFRAVPDVRIAPHGRPDRWIGVATHQLVADIDVIGIVLLGLHRADLGAMVGFLLFLRGCIGRRRKRDGCNEGRHKNMDFHASDP